MAKRIQPLHFLVMVLSVTAVRPFSASIQLLIEFQSTTE